jgi:hypothetical protein
MMMRTISSWVVRATMRVPTVRPVFITVMRSETPKT